MKQFPIALRLYLVIMWVVGLLALASSWLSQFDPRPVVWPLLIGLLALLIVAESLPRHIFSGAKTSPNTIPLFIAVIILPVNAAVSIALISVVIAQIINRRPWYETAFNVASTVVGVFVGGTICAVLALVKGAWAAPVAALVSAAALYLVNSSLVAGAVATQHRLPYLDILQKVAQAQPLDHAIMFAAGGFLALPWPWKPAFMGFVLAGVMLRFLQAQHRSWSLRRQQS